MEEPINPPRPVARTKAEATPPDRSAATPVDAVLTAESRIAMVAVVPDLTLLVDALAQLGDAERLSLALDLASSPRLVVHRAPEWGRETLEVAAAQAAITNAFASFRDDGTVTPTALSSFFDPEFGAGSAWQTATAHLQRLAQALVLRDIETIRDASPIVERIVAAQRVTDAGRRRTVAT